MKEIEGKYNDLTYRIIGCALEVHKILGCGFLEYVYHDAFEYELKKEGLIYEREKQLLIPYKDITLEHKYRVDFFVENKIIVELKASKKITGIDEAITINYINSGEYDIGLLFNFGELKLKYKSPENRKYLK